MKPFCADLITLDVNYKRLKKEITKAKNKREDATADNKPRGKGSKTKGRKAETEQVSAASVKSKKPKGKKPKKADKDSDQNPPAVEEPASKKAKKTSKAK